MRVGPHGFELALEIVLLERNAVLSVPFGAFLGMPLPLTFRVAAGHLPDAQTRVGSKPLATDPAGAFSAATLLSHRVLLLIICWRTMVDCLSIGEKKKGWVREIGGGFTTITIRWVRLQSLGGSVLHRWWHTRQGSKIWRFRYFVEGKCQEIALGRWPELTLAKARKKRLEYRRMLLEGIDPAIGRKQPE